MSVTLRGKCVAQPRLDEAERQLVLMALAHLSIERPGWDDALNRLALKMDGLRDAKRALTYDEFRRLRRGNLEGQLAK